MHAHGAGRWRAVPLGEPLVVGLAVDDLQADDLPGRQLGGLAVLAPQAQGDGGRVVQIAGLLPVADLRVVARVSAGQEKGVVVGELFEAAPHLLQRRLFAGDAEGDVPQTRQVGRFLVPGAGGDAGQGALLAARTGGGAVAGRRRPRAHSSHDGLLTQWSSDARAESVPETKLSRPQGFVGRFCGTSTSGAGRFAGRSPCFRLLRRALPLPRASGAVRDAGSPGRPGGRPRVRTPGPVRAPVPGSSGRAAGGSPWRRS